MKISESQLIKIVKEELSRLVSESRNISAKFSGVDLSQMSSRDLYRLDGDIAAALGGLGIDATDPDSEFESTPEVDELMRQRRDIKIAIRDSERASGARIKGHMEEGAYYPGKAVGGFSDRDADNAVAAATNQIRELIEEAHEAAERDPSHQNKGEGQAMANLVSFIDSMYEMYGSGNVGSF